MNTNTQNREHLITKIALPMGAITGLILAVYFFWNHSAFPQGITLPQSAILNDLIAFFQATLATDPLLIFVGVGFFGYYGALSTLARAKGLSTVKLLGLFKSTGFSVSLALVAAKLPRILEQDLTAAAAIAPVYHTLGWITFAVAAACLLELSRESFRLITTSRVNHESDQWS